MEGLISVAYPLFRETTVGLMWCVVVQAQKCCDWRSIHNVLLTCLKCPMCWSEAQPNCGISKHTQTHMADGFLCPLENPSLAPA